MIAVNKITGVAPALLLLAVLLAVLLPAVMSSIRVGTWERCKEPNEYDLREVVAPNQPPNNHIIALYLTKCHVNELKASDFNVNLPNLKYINVCDNHLQSVDPSVFNAFPTVTHLFLDNNNLTTVPVFKGASVLPNLEALFISDNQLKTLEDPEAFSSIKHLKLLDLDNNDIEHINPAVFQGLQNLERIYLSGNKLTYIPGKMFAIPSLLYVSLDENQIEYVAPGAFHGTKLGDLFLHNNKLTHLPEHFVSELTSTGGDLRFFMFYDNPFNCACWSELLAEVRQLNNCEYRKSFTQKNYNDSKTPQCEQANETKCKRLTEAEYLSQHLNLTITQPTTDKPTTNQP